MSLAVYTDGRRRGSWPWLASLERLTWALPALGLASVALQIAGAAAQLDDAVRLNITLILTQGAVFLLAVLALRRGAPIGLGFVLFVAALLRLTVLFLPPYHSSDIYRYVWDGWVQGAGINPYLYVPNDAALASLRDASVWPNINRADYAPTIYPPAAQAIFFLITRIPAGVIGMKIGWLAFECATAWTIVRLLDRLGLPRGRLLIYAWSPLVVWEVAGSGHLDAAMAAFLMLAVLARMRGRDGIAGMALGLAVLIKFFPLVVLPALWRRGDWKLPAACVGVIVCGYALYRGAGWKIFGFLSGYSHEEGLQNGAGFWFAHTFQILTGLTVPPILYVLGVALLLGCLSLVVVMSRDPARPIVGALILAACGMIALSPNHPWYFVWLTPLLCFAPSLPLLWIVAVSPLQYWPNSYSVPWNSDALYGGFCVLAVAQFLARIYARHRSSGEIQ